MKAYAGFDFELCRGVLRLPVGDEPIRIGRAAFCELFLPDSSVSDHHATVFRTDEGIFLRDEQSLNRSYAGGLALKPDTPRLLANPQRLRFGRVHIQFVAKRTEFELDDGAARSPSESAAGSTVSAALGMAQIRIDYELAMKALVPHLIVVQGECLGERCDLNLGAVLCIGRDPTCDLVLRDASVSAKHLDVRLVEHGLFIRDRGSSHGTLVGGRRILRDEWTLVDPGSTVGIGLAAIAFDALPPDRTPDGSLPSLAPNSELPRYEDEERDNPRDAPQILYAPADSLAFDEALPQPSLRPPVKDGLTEPPPAPPPDPKSLPDSVPPLPNIALSLGDGDELARNSALNAANQAKRDIRNFRISIGILTALIVLAITMSGWILVK